MYCSCKCIGYTKAAIAASKKATEINMQNYQNSLSGKIEKIET